MNPQDFRPVRTRRTFEEALDQILEAIRVGDLTPGEKLPSERTLAKAMEISRPTLREALRLLVDAQLIAPRQGGGMYVVSDNVPANLLHEQTLVRMTEVAAVLEARRLVEPRVAQLAALYADDADFDALWATIELQRDVLDDPIRYMQLDYRFHLTIARATKNPSVVSVMRTILRQLRLARDMALRGPREPELTLAVHVKTVEALMQADPTTIEAVMDEHLSYLEDLWEDEARRPRFRPIPPFLRPTGLAGGTRALTSR